MTEEKLTTKERKSKMASQQAAILGNLDGLTALVSNQSRRANLLEVRKAFLNTMK